MVKVARIQPAGPPSFEPGASPAPAADIPEAPLFADEEGTKWRVLVAACLSRYPRITPDKTPEELQYAVFRAKMDLEKSCLSADELKEEEERKRRAKNPNEDDAPNSFAQVRDEFIPAPRATPEDLSNNRQSLNRHLQHTLVLLVKGKQGWSMPTLPLGVGENLRSTMERCVARTIGSDVHTYTVGNIPCGVLVQPSTAPNQPGTKIFFLRSVYVAGEPAVHQDFKEFVWVPVFEMDAYLSDKKYLQAVQPFAR